MSLDLQFFSAFLSKEGIAKQNRFKVFFTMPDALGGNIDLRLTFRAESASIPGRNIATIDDQRDTIGPQRKIGYAPSYENFSATLICNRSLGEKDKLDRWLDLVVGDYRVRNVISDNNVNVGYYNDYVGTIEVEQYDETGAPTYRVRLSEAYPISITSLESSWSSSDTHKITAAFAYRYYQSVNSIRPTRPIAKLNVPDSL